jgi:gluconokinase
MYIIGADIGTGSTKAVAVDENGKVLITAQVPYPTLTPIPGVSEQEPDIIWQAFVMCIRRITESLDQRPMALSLSSAMHSIIPVDHNGNALHHLITWADNRSADAAEKIKNSDVGRTLYEQTGTPIHSMTPLCKLVWMKQHLPSIFVKAAKFISIKEYVWFKMFGDFEVDFSIASATGLFDIIDHAWHKQALSLAGITEDKLSTPVNTTYQRNDMIAEVALSLNVDSVIPVMIGASDGCLANVGSFATTPGTAALTIGTSGAIRVTGSKPSINWDLMTFNYCLDDATFVSGGPVNNGGIALKWYAKNLLGKNMESDSDYEKLLEPLAHIPPGSEGLIFLPYVLGERAPIWNSEACGVFFGLTARHTQEQLTKAVIEGITLSLHQIARGIESGGQRIDTIHVSGGFVKSHHWVQLLANITGKKILLVNMEDASAMGAAFLYMKKAQVQGAYTSFNESDTVSFLPDAQEHQFYLDSVFPFFEQLYKSLAADMHTLHKLKKENTFTKRNQPVS